MDLLKAVHSNDWNKYDRPLMELAEREPLELDKAQEHIIIARIKKLARDPDNHFPNALALVHMSYEEQEWERQNSIGDIVRPSPSDRKAWEQYEQFIQLSVKLLAQYRGIKGDWRTDAFDTVPTNHRASMGSMAAARVKESVSVRWNSVKNLNIVMETIESTDNLFKNDGVYEDSTIGAVADMIAAEVSELGFIVAEGLTTDNSMVLYLYDDDAEIVDLVTLSM